MANNNRAAFAQAFVATRSLLGCREQLLQPLQSPPESACDLAEQLALSDPKQRATRLAAELSQLARAVRSRGLS